MSETRKKLIQELLQKFTCTFRQLNDGTCFEFKKYKLTKPEIDIIFLLSNSPEGLSVKSLANEMKVTSGAITQFIDSLTAKKLVSREEDLKDRRIQKIKLRESTKKIFSEFKKIYFLSVSPFFDNLDDKELTELLRLLKKLLSYSENTIRR